VTDLPTVRILYAASEVAGFAKTGGLADVAAALPRALAQRGHDVTVVLPLYRAVRAAGHPLEPTHVSVSVPVGDRTVTGSYWRSKLPGSDVPVLLVEQRHYFERDNPAEGRSFYQWASPDGRKYDYSDNCERFVFFSRAVLEAPRLLDTWPDVVHVNDWQTALVPVYLKEIYRHHPTPELRPHYQRVRSLLTIHNLAYQGLFWHMDLPLTGLPWRLYNDEQLEFYGKLNFLKGGLVFADLLNTVSPTYAREIQTRYFGCGLQGVLANRSKHLFGIVNGVDDRVWNPATDRHLPATYTAETLPQGKAVCKQALQRQLGLAEEPRTPLLGMVSRLVEQKGLDLIGRSATGLLELGAQLVFLGEGDLQYHKMLNDLRARHPQRVSVTLSQSEPLAHLIEAGADVFLMPSLFEPCGLSQMYSLKYGTAPVVRATGGLADTVADATPERLAAGTATGFSFIPDAADVFVETVRRAVTLYRDDPGCWLQLLRTGMQQDWSWQRSAGEYEALYQRLRVMK
jgi:starch synthase